MQEVEGKEGRMTGGTWYYLNDLESNYHITDLPLIVKTLMQVFSVMDKAESGSIDKKEVQEKIYKYLLDLGNTLWGGRDDY